jgi:hypothetical protein
MRRRIVVLVLILLAAVWPATPSPATGSSTTQPAPPTGQQADFNNDGADDLAVGVPGQHVGAPPFNSGAVNVLYGSATGLSATGSQLFTQNTPGIPGTADEGDFFGDALAAGDFNSDGFADLAVGAPFESVGSALSAGAVNVLYGSAAGLTTAGSQLFTQAGGTIEADDLFGFTLTAGDFDNDGFADLAAGAPQEDVRSLRDAGAVSILYGSAAGLTTTGSQLFTQAGGTVEADDRFAWSLTAGDFDNDGFADLAAGAPFEDVTSRQDAGAVSALYGSAAGLTTIGSRLFTQVGGTVEAGDWFAWSLTAADFDGNGFADLAAGAPIETVGAVPDTGAVSILPGTADGLSTTGGQLFTQVANPPEDFDQFGFTLAAGDFDDDGFADLAADARNEAVGAAQGAGAVSILYGTAAGLSTTGGQFFTQVAGTIEQRDEFGRALAVGDFNGPGFDDLAAAAPSETVGTLIRAGAVSAIYGTADGLSANGGQIFTQDTPGVPGTAEDEDQFGEALATGNPG